MRHGEFYSIDDLANSLSLPAGLVAGVLDFLERYGFAERLSKREVLFQRSSNALLPSDGFRILNSLAVKESSTSIGMGVPRRSFPHLPKDSRYWNSQT
jgi:hypothetical protein